MTTVDIPMSGLSEADHRSQLRRALIASTVGTTIEWYDFLLCGQVTSPGGRCGTGLATGLGWSMRLSQTALSARSAPRTAGTSADRGFRAGRHGGVVAARYRDGSV